MAVYGVEKAYGGMEDTRVMKNFKDLNKARLYAAKLKTQIGTNKFPKVSILRRDPKKIEIWGEFGKNLDFKKGKVYVWREVRLK